MTIDHVSDTARWVAWYRAMESERPDAIFRDPWARALAGDQGERIVKDLRRGEATAWAMIVRTALFDELILRELDGHRVDLVVNLAAGLDTRPWRLDLPGKIRWVDVDLPGILDHKLATLAGAEPRCTYEAVKVDLTEEEVRRGVLAELAGGAERALVMTEGLLIYLTPEQVASLAQDLHAVSAFMSWITDLASPRLLKIMTRHWGKATDEGGASFRFAPAEGTRFFASFGWREAQFRSTWEESRRLDRSFPLAWLWRFLGRLQPAEAREAAHRISGTVLLERDNLRP
jgi:methyltransferase (TIGR00027 family)